MFATNFRISQPTILGAIAAVASLASAGCGGKPANYPDTAPVTGTVTLDGQPLEGATVAFAPTDGRGSGGVTDANGKYELRYTGSIKGAMLGAHRVVITKMVPDTKVVPPPPTDGDDAPVIETPPDMTNILPERYRGTDSELTAEVKPTENVINFDLTSG